MMMLVLLAEVAPLMFMNLPLCGSTYRTGRVVLTGMQNHVGSRDSLLVRVLDSLSKDYKFKSWQELGENFLLQS